MPQKRKSIFGLVKRTITGTGGFKVSDTEETAGARKVWFDCKEGMSRDEAANAVKAALEAAGLDCYSDHLNDLTGERELRFDGGEVETQFAEHNPGILFMATYKGGQAGAEYSMGIDC